ncbi:MAG TPA: hypothetical protein PKC18_07590 [Lacipirellulaceae bacterium]|nr:hypothetical protein [Lacipirellulaceae bacterium]HMP05452.1 hypothetical protein [Lacipirellulaceae bacterium]
MMKNTSREVVTLMLLQEDKDAAIAEARRLRQRLNELKAAVDHLDLAIEAIKSSPLRRAVGGQAKGLLGDAASAMPLRPGLITRLFKSSNSNGK